MPYPRPTLDELRREVRRGFEAEIPGADASLPQTFLGVTADALARLSHDGHGHLDWVVRQTVPTTAEDEWLDRHAGLHGLPRKPASAAAGRVLFFGTPERDVPLGAVLTRADGTEYRTLAAARIGTDGTASAPVTAALGGAEGNIPAGARLTLATAIVGVEGVAEVAAGGITNGAPAETNAQLQARLGERLASPPHGGAEHDYVGWAKTVEGVTRAWPYPRNRGAGTVDLAFVMDDSSPSIPPPDSPFVAAVQRAVDAARPVTADCVVFAPAPRPVDIHIRLLVPVSPSGRERIVAELADQFFLDAEPGAPVYLSRLGEAISRAAGERAHRILLPADDLPGVRGHMPVLGQVVFAP